MGLGNRYPITIIHLYEKERSLPYFVIAAPLCNNTCPTFKYIKPALLCNNGCLTLYLIGKSIYDTGKSLGKFGNLDFH